MKTYKFIGTEEQLKKRFTNQVDNYQLLHGDLKIKVNKQFKTVRIYRNGVNVTDEEIQDLIDANLVEVLCAGV